MTPFNRKRSVEPTFKSRTEFAVSVMGESFVEPGVPFKSRIAPPLSVIGAVK